MFFFTLALAFAAVYHAARATSLATRITAIAASFPVVDLRAELSSLHTQATPVAHANSVQDATQATVDGELLLCNDLNCDECQVVDLTTIPLNSCIFAGFFFESVAVVQPNVTRLPFDILLSPTTECLTGTRLEVSTAPNTCFNVGGNGFDDFELINPLA
ncbi:hypothetical protein FKP32DRAFT_663790 [Trametes sanguinea]|nr:hypothetical protein FKP32DRAFT_663790 [Trametes sanguinea]